METRTLYFLKDSITSKFYVNAGTLLGKFENAIIHTTHSSVVAGLKSRVRLYKHNYKAGEDVALNNIPHIKKMVAVAKRRLKKTDCAIEIVPIKISI